ncbi:MAG: hypothetical protein ACXWPM_05975 [Bdellovibrionota bacterium]
MEDERTRLSEALHQKLERQRLANRTAAAVVGAFLLAFAAYRLSEILEKSLWVTLLWMSFTWLNSICPACEERLDPRLRSKSCPKCGLTARSAPATKERKKAA